jgi:hypothetical protein
MSVRLSGAGIVRLHAQVRFVPLKRRDSNLAHERPLCAIIRSFRSRPPSCAAARKTTQATHPSHVRGPLLLGMQVACAMQSNSAMRAMMSANSNVRRRGCATVQGTKTGALRSTCKGAGWTPPFIPNIASPTFDIHMLPLTASRSASVRTAPFANRSASPVAVGKLMGNGHLVWQGDYCGRR